MGVPWCLSRMKFVQCVVEIESDDDGNGTALFEVNA